MSDFRKNLRSELDYQMLTVKELSAKTGIPKSSLDGYLAHKPIKPTVEVAVKIAKALGCSVEYLVTGKEESSQGLSERQKKFEKILDDLSLLPEEKVGTIRSMVHAVALEETKRKNITL